MDPPQALQTQLLWEEGEGERIEQKAISGMLVQLVPVWNRPRTRQELGSDHFRQVIGMTSTMI